MDRPIEIDGYNLDGYDFDDDSIEYNSHNAVNALNNLLQ